MNSIQPGFFIARTTAALVVLLTLTMLRGESLAQPAAAGVSETANPNAMPDARAIMRYVRSLPFKADKKLISGQFESWGLDVTPLSSLSNNLTIVHERTGKWVGLVGVEYHAGAVYPERPNLELPRPGTAQPSLGRKP